MMWGSIQIMAHSVDLPAESISNSFHIRVVPTEILHIAFPRDMALYLT